MSQIPLFADFDKCLEETRFDDAVTVALAEIFPGASGGGQEAIWDRLTRMVYPWRIAEGRYIEGCPLLLGCWQAVAKEQGEPLHVWSQGLHRECLPHARSRLPLSDRHTALAILACAQVALAAQRYDYEHLLRWGWQATHWFAVEEPGAPPADMADMAAGIHWPSQSAGDIVDLSFSALARASSHPVGRARDLTRWLLHGTKDHDTAIRACALKVPLYHEGRAEGIVATLLLTLVAGHGELYADPITMAFRAWDGDFEEACQVAWTFSQRNRGPQLAWDIRWHLRTPEPMALKGRSLGGAFGVGLQHLLDGMPLDLSTSITATIDAEGQLGPVEYLEDKIKALKRPEEKIARLIIGQDNRIDVKDPAFEPLEIEVVRTVAQASEIASGLIPELTTYLQSLFERLGDLPWFYPHDMPFETVHVPVTVSQERLRYGGSRADRQGRKSQGSSILAEAATYVWRTAEAYNTQARYAVVRQWEEIRGDVLQRGAHGAVILGDPGFGKTHLLRVEGRRLAREALSYLQAQGSAGGVVPLFARLVDLAGYEGELEDALRAFLRREYGLSETLLAWIHRKLPTAECLLLLDGWDEVPLKERDFEDPASLAHRLERFARTSACRILLSSRITGYHRAPLSWRGRAGQELELVAFEPGQVEQFIEAWFQGQPATGKRLVQALHDSPQLMGLARIPLLLSFICLLVQESDSPLPARRVALYEECLYGLLQRWQVARRGHHIDRAYVDAKIELLGEIALGMLQGEGRLFSLDLLRGKVEEVLNRLMPSHPLYGRRSNDLIAELTQQDGVLIEAGSGETAHILFLHQTFQEYLAARALARKANGLEEIKKYIWSYPEWEEVIVLYAAMTHKPQELIAGILAEPDDIFHTGLFLAGRCAAECGEGELPQKLVEKLWHSVYQLLDEAPHHRHRICQLLAAMARANRTCMGRLNEECKGRNPRTILKVLGILRELNIPRPELLATLLASLKSRRRVFFAAADVLSSLGWVDTLAPLYTPESLASGEPQDPLRDFLMTQTVSPWYSDAEVTDEIFRHLFFYAVFGDQADPAGLLFKLSQTVVRAGWLRGLFQVWKVCLGFALGATMGLLTGALIRISRDMRSMRRGKGKDLVSHLLPGPAWVDRRLSPGGVVAMLTSPSPFLRWSSVESLQTTDRHGVDDLAIAMLQVIARRDDNLNVRLEAIQTLIELGHATPDIIGILLEGVRHENPLVRQDIVEKLAAIPGVPTFLVQLEAIGDKTGGSEKAVEGLVVPLRSLLSDAMDEIIREARVMCATEAFTQAFGAETMLVRRITSILEVMRFFLDKEDVPPLQRILRSAPQVVAVLSQVMQNRAERQDKESAGSTHLSIPVSEPFWERMRTIEALGSVRPPNRQALDSLLEAIRCDHNIWVCTKAIQALHQFGPLDPQTLTQLLQMYHGASNELSAKILEALGQLGEEDHPGITEAFIEALRQDGDPQVRRTAASVLRAFGRPDSQVIAVFFEAMEDQDGQVRREAAHALGDLGDEETLQELCRLWGKVPRAQSEEVLLALHPLSGRLKWKLWQASQRRRLSLRPVG